MTPIAPARSHLREALHWSRAPVGWRAVLVGMLGVAAPVLVGSAIGQVRLGLGIGLGAMLLGGSGEGAVGRRFDETIVPAAVAIALAAMIAGRAWSDPAMIALLALAAIVGGYSRPFAVASVRFAIYFVLAVVVLEQAPERTVAAVAFALGAVWNMLLRRLIAGPGAPPEPARAVPRAKRIAAFRERLRALAAWQYAIRLTAGLSVAAILRHLWPAHHGGWLLITVALLTGRVFERYPLKVTQRVIGVTLGVATTWLIVTEAQGPWVLGGIVVVLAALLPVFRSASYLLYSAAMTPMILLVLDYGRPPDRAMLVDRVAATLVGAAIVLALNAVLARPLRTGPG